MQDIDLRRIERNVWRDFCQDGLGDMLLGAHLLVTGLCLASDNAGFVVFPIIFYTPLLQGLKKRFSYPRTGYVELRQGDPQPLPAVILGSLALGLVALVAVLLAAGVLAEPASWYRWMPIMFGIWLAGVFLGLGLRIGLLRYYVVAAVALASGPVFALLPLTGKLENLGLFLTAVGFVPLAWGAVVFFRFLRQNPVMAEE